MTVDLRVAAEWNLMRPSGAVRACDIVVGWLSSTAARGREVRLPSIDHRRPRLVVLMLMLSVVNAR